VSVAVRILSTLAEIDLENPQYLRLISFKLEELGVQYLPVAVEVLRRVRKMRPEEPQSHLYLANLLQKVASQVLFLNQPSSDFHDARKDLLAKLMPRVNDGEIGPEPIAHAEALYRESISLYNEVLAGKWDQRFAQVEVTTLMEVNRLVNFVIFYGLGHKVLAEVDHRLMSPINTDIRVEITWDTDMTDVELVVKEPTGEDCQSFHNKTSIGGMMSRNFTHGYGPVEYLIRTAATGSYEVTVELYNSMKKFTGSTVMVKIWTHFGDPLKEREEAYTVRLDKDRQVCKVGSILIV